jgi:hypothetical protein
MPDALASRSNAAHSAGLANARSRATAAAAAGALWAAARRLAALAFRWWWQMKTSGSASFQTA